MGIAQGNKTSAILYSDFCHHRTKIQQFKVWVGAYKMWLEEPGLLHMPGQALEGHLQSKLQDKESRQHLLRHHKAQKVPHLGGMKKRKLNKTSRQGKEISQKYKPRENLPQAGRCLERAQGRC